MERLQITTKLHDELQGVLIGAAPYPSKYMVTPYRASTEFSFVLEGEYVKGCAEWTNAKEKREKKCLYALME
ncbi:hypothetical protein J11TS1_17240 [Oceanobacillus sp. J11TS1]|nr:hypothetical protein J11TS1_17240 [Oceanobacillus sp. J11TS1]